MGCDVCCGYAGGLSPNPAGCPACGPEYDVQEGYEVYDYRYDCCSVCGAEDPADCDEEEHAMASAEEALAEALCCSKCGAAVSPEGCPCGAAPGLILVA